MSNYRKVRVTLIKSAIGYTEDQRATVRALGLRKMHQSRVHTETPQIAGMLHKIRHLLQVEEVTE
ncbi:MAG: 50S ribosomal protein L30 [Phototrophicales bacterium]|jgi:large subunit ribosomal protein L30|nr:MAG: 50S ribosomal protein L30 [Phototrophicales bacterium]